MPQLVDVMVSISGIDRTNIARVVRSLLEKAKSKCTTPYYRVVLEGMGPQGRVVLVVLATSSGVRGEYTIPPTASLDSAAFSVAKVECLTTREFAEESAKARRPVVCASCGAAHEEPAYRVKPRSFEPLRLIQAYIDSKLSLRLASDPFWYARLMMKSQKVVEDEGGVEKAATIVLDLATKHRRALVVLKNGRKEFRIYVSTNKAGVALVEGTHFEAGVTAIDKARGLTGRIEGFKLLSRNPTLTI